MTTTQTAAAPSYSLIPIKDLTDFPLNPREHWGDMRALENSITAQGVLEPVLVRQAGDRYQVIAGARRLKAARTVGLKELPAIVRVATDAQALEIALVENGNRQDVHRLNEAIALDGLMKLDKTYTPAVLASHLGRPEKYVRETLKLLSLEPAARKAYAADEITAGHAVILSRLPKDQQAEGLRACFGSLWTGGYRDQILKSVKTLELWVRDHAPLELASPSVETRELFPEAVKLAQTGAAIVQVHKGYGDIKRKGSKDVILGEEHWKKAAAKDDCARAGVIVLGSEKGTIVRVCTDTTCAKHFPKPKHAHARPTTTGRSKDQIAQEKKANERAAAKRALEGRTIAAILKAVAETVDKVTPELARQIFERETLYNVDLPSDEVAAVFAEVTGLKASGRYNGIIGDTSKITDRQVARGLVVGLLSHDAYRLAEVIKSAKAYKVDGKKIAAAVAANAKAEAKAAAKAKPKAPAKKKAGRK